MEAYLNVIKRRCLNQRLSGVIPHSFYITTAYRYSCFAKKVIPDINFKKVIEKKSYYLKLSENILFYNYFILLIIIILYYIIIHVM